MWALWWPARPGESVTYGLYNAQSRGTLFIGAGVPVYEGMVIGQTPKKEDIAINACKRKQLTNTRAAAVTTRCASFRQADEPGAVP